MIHQSGPSCVPTRRQHLLAAGPKGCYALGRVDSPLDSQEHALYGMAVSYTLSDSLGYEYVKVIGPDPELGPYHCF